MRFRQSFLYQKHAKKQLFSTTPFFDRSNTVFFCIHFTNSKAMSSVFLDANFTYFQHEVGYNGFADEEKHRCRVMNGRINTALKSRMKHRLKDMMK